MTAVYNPRTTEASAPFMVFIHSKFEQYGETWAIVNKGTVKTAFTFKVRASLIA